MDYVVEKMESMKMIGFKRFFSFETSYEEIPKFWSEFTNKCTTGEHSKEEEKVIEECCIGEFGICICDDNNKSGFDYMIAGKYKEGDIPVSYTHLTLPTICSV